MWLSRRRDGATDSTPIRTTARPTPTRPGNLKIQVATGTGSGPTELAAFDSALIAAGIANYNLITLSSVIPPGSELVHVEQAVTDGNWGDRLYVVMAEHRESRHNHEAWAGIGWVTQNSTGKGLFVEHHGSNEAEVRRDIEDSLKGLVDGRREEFGPVEMTVTGATCNGAPICALAVAVYETAGWRS